MPALGGSRLALQEGLRDGGRGSAGARSHRFQHSLIVIETALAVVLLTSGGLLLQTFQHLRQTRSRHPQREAADLCHAAVPLSRLRPARGFRQRGVGKDPRDSRRDKRRRDFANSADGNRPVDVLSFRGPVRRRRPRPGRALAGRDPRLLLHRRRAPARRPVLRHSDRRSQSPAAIVNESFANRNFPGRSPLGARFKFGRSGEQGYWYTIVGVVKEIRDRGVAEELKPAVYRLHEQADQSGDQPSGIVVRTAVEPASIVAGGPAGDLVRRQEPAGHARSNRRRHRGSPVVRAVAEYRAFGRVRAARAVTRVARIVRCALLRRHAAHQRNRRAHGVGRDVRRISCCRSADAAGADARRDSPSVWSWRPSRRA